MNLEPIIAFITSSSMSAYFARFLSAPILASLGSMHLADKYRRHRTDELNSATCPLFCKDDDKKQRILGYRKFYNEESGISALGRAFHFKTPFRQDTLPFYDGRYWRIFDTVVLPMVLWMMPMGQPLSILLYFSDSMPSMYVFARDDIKLLEDRNFSANDEK